MEGIAIGTVVNNWDKEHQGMVQVRYQLGKKGLTQTNWIPVMSMFAGPSYGSYHLPEVGAMVVIGFADGNHHHPIVLGGIRGVDDTLPPDTANEKNSKKMWKSKSGYEFYVEEEEKKVCFLDPKAEHSLEWSSKEHTLTLDVKEKVILKLGGKPYLTLEKDKVTLEGDVTIQAKGITLKTEQDITLSPGKGTTIGGKQIKLEGTTLELTGKQMKLEGTSCEIKGKELKLEGTIMELKAQANATVESSGMLAVKGTMLKLN